MKNINDKNEQQMNEQTGNIILNKKQQQQQQQQNICTRNNVQHLEATNRKQRKLLSKLIHRVMFVFYSLASLKTRLFVFILLLLASQASNTHLFDVS